MSMAEGPVSVSRIEVPPIVIDGFDVIVPEAPLGQFAVALHPRLVELVIVKVPFVGLAADAQLVNIGGAYMGHSIKEAAGAAGGAEVDFYDGASAGGVLFNPVTLVTNESTRDWYPLPGIPMEAGVFAHVVSGTVSGCIYYGVSPEAAGRVESG